MFDELTTKAVIGGLTAVTGTLSTFVGAGILANVEGDSTLFGLNLTTIEKITLVGALMLGVIVVAWVARMLFLRLDAIQEARVKDAQDHATLAHNVIQANTQALDKVTKAVELNTEAVKDLKPFNR